MIDETSSLIDLTPEEENELRGINASKLDVRRLRDNQHHLANKVTTLTGVFNLGIDEIKGELKQIRDSLVVEVTNGTTHKASIGDLVKGIYERESDRRFLLSFSGWIKKHRAAFIVFNIIVFYLIARFNKEIIDFLRFVLPFIK